MLPILKKNRRLIFWIFVICLLSTKGVLWLTQNGSSSTENQHNGQRVQRGLRNIQPNDTIKYYKAESFPDTRRTHENDPTNVPLNTTTVSTTPNVTQGNVYTSTERDLTTVGEIKGKLEVNESMMYVHNVNLVLDNPRVCAGKKLDFIVYVHTSIPNIHKRQLIRTTWGNKTILSALRGAIVFLLGKNSEQNMQATIRMENEVYHDIIQGDFLDTYRNLTHKAMMGLKWVAKNCDHAKYVIKTDDDVFVNIFDWTAILDYYRTKESNWIACNMWRNSRVIRDTKYKWSLTKSEYSKESLPPYCAGLSYSMSMHMITHLIRLSRYTPFMWIDDVYITGLLPAQLKNATFLKFNQFYHFKQPQDFVSHYRSLKPMGLPQYLIATTKSLLELWDTDYFKYLIKRITH